MTSLKMKRQDWMRSRYRWRFKPSRFGNKGFIYQGDGSRKVVARTRFPIWWNNSFFRQTDWPTSWNAQWSQKKKVKVHVITTPSKLIEFERFSSWSRLINTFSWICIFIKLYLHKNQCRNQDKLSLGEKLIGETELLKTIQSEAFHDEVARLKSNQRISRSSKIGNLDPFLDKQGVLRVGGRLKFGKLPYASKQGGIDLQGTKA